VTVVPPGVDRTLDPGDVASLRAGPTKVRAANARSSFAVAMAISVAMVAAAERSAQPAGDAVSPGDELVAALLRPGGTSTAIAAGMRVEPLVRIRPPATTSDVIRMKLGRVVLRPGSSFGVDHVASVTGIAIETGTLELGSVDGRMEFQIGTRPTEPAPMLRRGIAVTLAPGDAVIVPPEDEAAFRNNGLTPAVVLVVTATQTPDRVHDPASPTGEADNPGRGQPS
jgi:hypothetical protein